MLRLKLKFRYHRIVLATLCAIMLYWFLLRKKKYTDKFEAIVDIEPKIAWEFIADFSNQQKLNPTIINFEIEYEKGNYENWEYSVIYKEFSITFPFLQYQNRGIFKVLPQIRKKLAITQYYRILHDFSSCVSGYCFQTDSEMLFIPNGEDSTKIEEVVTFECLPIISVLCYRDLRLQKRLIFDNIVESVYMMK